MMVSYLYAYMINPFPRNHHNKQKRMGQRREGKRKTERWGEGVWKLRKGGPFPLDQPLLLTFTKLPRYDNYITSVYNHFNT